MSETTAQRDNSAPEVLIVGGGPAGMMAGYLFARAGVTVRVLEKHADFFRDFRGDTVHPSTMEVLDQLGLLGRFLERPHDTMTSAQIRVAGRDYTIGDLSHLATPAPFIAMMPQWDFLDFLRDEAAALPAFALEMEAEAEGFVERDGRVAGVRLADGRELAARKLVIAADGRSSLVRRRALLPVTQLGAPMDVLWFRLPKADNPGDKLRGAIDTGRMAVLIDRRTYWQAAFLIPKGAAEEVKARGMGWLRGQMQGLFPELDLAGGLESAEDLHLLSVALDRLDRWHRPGLLAIGDAAHAMSPIGGIGINLAIQDAVAAANVLAGPLARGKEADGLLAKVQQRREFPTKVIQAGQKLAQDNVIGAVLSGQPITRAPWPVRLLDRLPLLRRIPGRIIGLGVRRERVESPYALPLLDADEARRAITSRLLAIAEQFSGQKAQPGDRFYGDLGISGGDYVELVGEIEKELNVDLDEIFPWGRRQVEPRDPMIEELAEFIARQLRERVESPAARR